MSNQMTANRALAWKRGFEAAREAARTLTRREPVDIEHSVRLALDLIETCRRQGIWPGSNSDRERSVATVRDRWIKLKRTLRP